MPTYVNVTSNPERVISITTDVILTCTIVLNSTLENISSVSVTIEWLKSSRVLSAHGTTPSVQNDSSLVYLSTFQPTRVGNYSCIAIVNTSIPYLTASSGADSIVVGKW